ncbi:hypothetical protein PanWU01x14_049360 [Parasponia andersonii]|uniref:Uncharacterized protein n=1 Tax=Parasponia andersonii TaxID=3476 RepID=A0A2P5DML0_PARAD|nr:hypothetical protein PanWU01x14_049360 [Parasponia andersonii]
MESPLHKIFTVDQMGNPAFSCETESFPSKSTFPSQFLNLGTPQNHQQRNFNGGRRSNQGRNSRTFLRIKAKKLRSLQSDSPLKESINGAEKSPSMIKKPES